jgi:multidrug efflux system membrane fusion protein
MKKLYRGMLAVLLIGILAIGANQLLSRGTDEPKNAHERGGAADVAIPVLVGEARVADVPVYLTAVGTVRALNLVTVRTQVNGTLVRIAFQEGQDVKKGDVLAEIDPTVYKAQLDQQLAKKALDEAVLANAKLDLDRYTGLIKSNAVTKQQFDTQKALVDQQEAQLRVDEALINNQRAYLNWCTITSPIDGRIGIRQVDMGNIVSTTDASGIVVVTQLQPITVLFNLPQQQLSRVNRAFAKGTISIQAIEGGNHAMLDSGVLRVVNNQVDQTTGTVQYKAEFPNAETQLWPGQFVNVQLLVDTFHQVVVVPTAAVQRSPSGPFVYVVQPDGTVKLTNVTVPQDDAVEAIIASGVGAGDRVVISGFAQIADGRRVVVTKDSASLEPSQVESPSRRLRPSEQQIQPRAVADNTDRPRGRSGGEGSRSVPR